MSDLADGAAGAFLARGAGQVVGRSGGCVQGCVDAGLQPGALHLTCVCDCLGGAVEHVAQCADGQRDSGDTGVDPAWSDAAGLAEGVQQTVQFAVIRLRVQRLQNSQRVGRQRHPAAQVRRELPGRVTDRTEVGGVAVQGAQQVVNGRHH